MAEQNVLDLEEARLINKGLKIREQIVDALFVDNKIPSSEEDRELLMRAIEGSDRTILGKAKLKVDKDNNGSAQEVAKVMASILSKVTVKNAQGDKQPPELPKDIRVTDVIEGEKNIGVENLSYDDIMNKD